MRTVKEGIENLPLEEFRIVTQLTKPLDQQKEENIPHVKVAKDLVTENRLNSIYIEWVLCNKQEDGKITNSHDNKSKKAFDLTTVKRSEGKFKPD